jgi:hypothetical protein
MSPDHKVSLLLRLLLLLLLGQQHWWWRSLATGMWEGG